MRADLKRNVKFYKFLLNILILTFFELSFVNVAGASNVTCWQEVNAVAEPTPSAMEEKLAGVDIVEVGTEQVVLFADIDKKGLPPFYLSYDSVPDSVNPRHTYHDWYTGSVGATTRHTYCIVSSGSSAPSESSESGSSGGGSAIVNYIIKAK